MHDHNINEMAEALAPLLTNAKDQARAVGILRQYWDDKIALTWSIEDVHNVANEHDLALTNDEAWEILRSVLDGHDASLGVCWDTLWIYLQESGLGRALTGKEKETVEADEIVSVP